MIKHGTFRDGGTRFFKNLPANEYFGKDDMVCQDNRINSNTVGEWYLGYPNKEGSRKLTEEEKDFVIQEIIAFLGREYRRMGYFYKSMRSKNKNYLFKDDFNKEFSMVMYENHGKNYKAEYENETGWKIIDENNRAILFNYEGDKKGSGTLKECFIQYNILIEV